MAKNKTNNTYLGWAKKYLLNFDAIMCICIFVIALYFIFTRKRKKLKVDFKNLKLEENSDPFPYYVKKKKKKNKHEEECRRIFQDIFDQRFKSVRPDWLKNPATGKNLELDGFNDSIRTPLGIGLAFEYDGKQHSEYNEYFHKGNIESFKYQIKKDNYKDVKCKEKGVLLVRIPHFVAFLDLRRYITEELRRLRVIIPPPAIYRGLEGFYS